MGDVKLSALERLLRSKVQRYDEDKYWRYRQIVIDPSKGSKLGDLWRLYYIKRADAFNGASMGTHRGFGARFATPPRLPHGLNGIIVSHNAVIGKNCTIFHQVTIGEGKGGAGCIVTQDIPDGATVVMERPRIIIRKD